MGIKDGKPIRQDLATDFVNCKVIFKYTDFYKTTTYITFPVDDYNKYKDHFHPLDMGLIADIKSVYTEFDEINNLIDYIGTASRIVSIDGFRIKKLSFYEDGCKCTNCKEFYPMAVPNQPDNTLICYSCRDNPWR